MHAPYITCIRGGLQGNIKLITGYSGVLLTYVRWALEGADACSPCVPIARRALGDMVM